MFWLGEREEEEGIACGILRVRERLNGYESFARVGGGKGGRDLERDSRDG